MGKGDKKTKRGKIIIGSTGVSRQKKKKPVYIAPKPKTSKVEVKKEEVIEVVAEAPVPKKTATAKKTTAKKATTTKKATPAKKTTTKKATTAKKATTTKKEAKPKEEKADKE